MANKRRREEEDEFDVSDIARPSPKAKVRGVVSTISPMKKSKTCSYFDGELTDGKATMRIFGFDGSVRRKLLEEGSGSAVAITNCEIKKARRGEQLEVIT